MTSEKLSKVLDCPKNGFEVYEAGSRVPQYYVMLGPDTNFETLQTFDMQVATISNTIDRLPTTEESQLQLLE
jgi:hypothetical protein